MHQVTRDDCALTIRSIHLDASSRTHVFGYQTRESESHHSPLSTLHSVARCEWAMQSPLSSAARGDIFERTGRGCTASLRMCHPSLLDPPTLFFCAPPPPPTLSLSFLVAPTPLRLFTSTVLSGEPLPLPPLPHQPLLPACPSPGRMSMPSGAAASLIASCPKSQFLLPTVQGRNTHGMGRGHSLPPL